MFCTYWAVTRCPSPTHCPNKPSTEAYFVEWILEEWMAYGSEMSFFDFIVLMIGSLFLFKAFDFTFCVSFFCFFWFPQFFSFQNPNLLPWGRSSIPVSLLWVFFIFSFVNFLSFVGLCCLDAREVVESELFFCWFWLNFFFA